MKKTLAVMVLLLVAFLPVVRASAQSSASVAAGSRYHIDHSVYQELPFNGNYSVAGAYAWHEEAGYWQVALDYVPMIPGTNTIEGVYTPQLNLIFDDGIWRGGGGVCNTYFAENGAQGAWTGFYWQFLAGINIPVKTIDVDLLAYYVFQDWRSLREFDLKDIEFGVWLNFSI